MKIRKIAGLALALLALEGCATVGSDFQFKGRDSIVTGKTTKNDILTRYGQPFRVGYENGDEKWTYGYYQYKLFGDSQTKDLAVTFKKNGVVSSYSYSSSYPDDINRAHSVSN
jgi:hypothetical protein